MASILKPFRSSFFPAMTKIVGTLGPRSRSVEVISACLQAGMLVVDSTFRGGTLNTVGPELHVIINAEKTISLQEDGIVVLTPNQGQETSSDVLPINFSGLAKAVKKGDTIFLGQYLFTGSETTSVWLEYFNKKKRKSLFQAFDKIKSELMMLGFISLLLTISERLMCSKECG
ncbi:hypothetical protein ACSBR2_021607 [Camellia fascicularis]